MRLSDSSYPRSRLQSPAAEPVDILWSSSAGEEQQHKHSTLHGQGRVSGFFACKDTEAGLVCHVYVPLAGAVDMQVVLQDAMTKLLQYAGLFFRNTNYRPCTPGVTYVTHVQCPFAQQAAPCVCVVS